MDFPSAYYGAALRAARRDVTRSDLTFADIKGPDFLTVLRLYPFRRGEHPVIVYLFGEYHIKTPSACSHRYYTIKEWLESTDFQIDPTRQEVHLLTEDSPFQGRHKRQDLATYVLTDVLDVRPRSAFIKDVWSFAPHNMSLRRVDARYLAFMLPMQTDICNRIKQWRQALSHMLGGAMAWEEGKVLVQQLSDRVHAYQELCEAVVDFAAEDPVSRILLAMTPGSREPYEEMVRAYVERRSELLSVIPLHKQRGWQVDLINGIRKHAIVFLQTIDTTTTRLGDIHREWLRLKQSLRRPGHDQDETLRLRHGIANLEKEVKRRLCSFSFYQDLFDNVDLAVMDSFCMLTLLSIIHRTPEDGIPRSKAVIGYFGLTHSMRYDAWLRWMYNHDKPPIFEHRGDLDQVWPQCILKVPSLQVTLQPRLDAIEEEEAYLPRASPHL